MWRKLLTGSLALGVLLVLLGTAQAYHINFTYGANANYSYAEARHYTDYYTYVDDWDEQYASGEALASAFKTSAEAEAYTRPIGWTDPICEVSGKVDENTTFYSYAYAYSDSWAEFKIAKDVGDTCDLVSVTFKFNATGGFNLDDGATSSYYYFLNVNGNELYKVYDHYCATGTHSDYFETTLNLPVDVTHNFQVVLDGDVDHTSTTENYAWYKADLDIVDIKCIPIPSALLLLGSGLVGLTGLAWRRRG